MNVDSYLEMFTLLFGWLFYNNIWFVLSESGVIFLPLIGIVFDGLLDQSTEVDLEHAGQKQKAMIVELTMALFVIMLAGSPFLTFRASEVVFRPTAMHSTATRTLYTINNVDATYANNLSFGDHPIDIEVPVFWWLVHNVSAGINLSVMEGIPQRTDLRRYLEALRTLYIRNPYLRHDVNAFRRDCYIKAKSKFEREKPHESGQYQPTIEEILGEHGKDDPFWLGSRTYLSIPGYYDFYRSEGTVKGFLYSSIRDTEWSPDDPNKPIYGRPTCKEWWSKGDIGLRDRILDETSFIESLSSVVEYGWSTEKRHDALIRVVLNSSPPRWLPRGYDYSYENVSSDGFLGQVEAGVKQTGAVVGTAYETITNSVNVTAILNAGPMMQSIVLMTVYFCIPFILLLSKFQLKALVTTAWGIFTIKFFTALWFFVWWIDQSLMASMYPNLGELTTLSLFEVPEKNKQLTLNYLTTILYIGMPVLFTMISGWVGWNVIRGISAGGGLYGGLRSVGDKAGAALKKVLTKGKSKGKGKK